MPTPTKRTRRVVVGAIVVGVLALAALTQLPSSDTLANLTGNATVTRTATTGTVVHGSINEGGKSYSVLEQNPKSYPNYTPPCSGDLNCRHRPLENIITTSGCQGGVGGCFVFDGAAVPASNCSAGCPNDREEIRLSGPTDTDTMNLGEWRYEKFSIRFDPSTTIAPPNNPRTIIAQMWQQQTSLTLGPPLAITATDAGAGVRLDFLFRSDPDQTKPSHTFYSLTVPKGPDFTTLCWKMKPSATGPRGAFFIWQGNACQGNLDQTAYETAINYNPDDLAGGACAVNPANWTPACVAASHEFFNWGYVPSADAQDAFDIRVGLYRPPVMNPILFWLDDIKLTKTAASLVGS